MKKMNLLIYVFSASLLMPLAAMGKEGTNANCKIATNSEVEQLFKNWNAALLTLDPNKVTALYAENGILLPTISNIPRTNHQQIKNYFTTFLKKHPQGKIDSQIIRSGCNWATDTGLYTFTFKGENGNEDTVGARYSFAYEHINNNWLIVSHHSSLLPNSVDPIEDKKQMSELEQGQR